MNIMISHDEYLPKLRGKYRQLILSHLDITGCIPKLKSIFGLLCPVFKTAMKINLKSQ